MMKKILATIAIAIMAIACEQKVEITPKVTITSPAESLTIPNAGGELSLAFESNVEWTASVNESWCTITPASGAAGTTSVKIVALENKTNDNRTVTVVIKAGAVEAKATVTQLQKDAFILNGEKAFQVPFEGGEIKFAVDHNVSFEATADVDWLTNVSSKAMETSEVVFAVAANKGAERKGTITVKSSVATETITVTQAVFVPKMNVEPKEEQWIALEGGSVSVAVDANVEYDVTVGKNDWLKMSNEGAVYTFTAEANQSFDYRSVEVSITPKDESLAEFAVSFYVFQNGRAEKLWSKNPATIDGFDPKTHSRLAKYGDNIALGNTNRAFLLNPKDGSVVGKFDIPGFSANSVCVDDAGHIILANDAPYGGTISIYYLPDPTNPAPQLIASWDTANYYGFNVGNLRVKGDITKDAVMSAVVSAGAGGAVIMWEITDGKCGDWKWTSVPYEVSEAKFACAAPLGTKISDGLLYAGYGGDYNIKCAASPVLSGASTWVTSYTTGYSWMENINCITSCEYKGKKYAAFTAGCHFAYDDADAILLDITDPTKAELVYKYAATYDVERADDWSNLQFSSGGTFSDILLIPGENELLMVYIDSNYGSMACISIK